MITRSSNLATNILIERLTPARVQAVAEDAGAADTRIVRGVQDLKAFDAGLVNVTTAHDLALVLQALYGEAVETLLSAFDPKKSGEIPWFLQFLRDQEFNEMIPAGLPPATTVFHKTGQITSIHHDAALVVIPYPGLHLSATAVLVVMTRGFEDPRESAALGARVARTIHEFVLEN
jgi:beta-lactamase class A